MNESMTPKTDAAIITSGDIYKQCSVCDAVKPTSEFHKRNGHCKTCKTILDQGRQRSNSRSATRNNTANARERKRRWARLNRDRLKESAYRQLRSAIESGNILPPNACAKCGQSPRRRDGARAVQAHHAFGYEKPLDVIWLCPPCHREAHAAIEQEKKNG